MTKTKSERKWLWTQKHHKWWKESKNRIRPTSSIRVIFRHRKIFTDNKWCMKMTDDNFFFGWKSSWTPIELTDNMRWMSTWNATKATSIQLNQCGSSALLNEIAKKMVTTAREKAISNYANSIETGVDVCFTHMHKCVRHFRRANATNWRWAASKMLDLAGTAHRTVAGNIWLPSQLRWLHADYLPPTSHRYEWRSE